MINPEKWNGNTMGGTTPRLADDAYFTPDKLALAICRKLRAKIGVVDSIREPIGLERRGDCGRRAVQPGERVDRLWGRPC